MGDFPNAADVTAHDTGLSHRRTKSNDSDIEETEEFSSLLPKSKPVTQPSIHLAPPPSRLQLFLIPFIHFVVGVSNNVPGVANRRSLSFLVLSLPTIRFFGQISS